ncbi:alpha/beta fold hydrolase [Ahrensia sp. 13_GOM-1096m]|uniref:alpha/beta fold hydrolase n=1 Tax=Ahrensia sp. 13_GOM-1096m TaxID=1380380 RepID=UPI0004792DE4|nr:alpha/beta hydrolase [Ahrensia sp. 13_GOM-1096m]
MNAIKRNNVVQRGSGRAMMFAHGYGCDQNMWRFVAPTFEENFTTVLFDHVGAGGSDLSAYDFEQYSSLDRYAEDILEIGSELNLRDAIFVGHSVSAMIGALATIKSPSMFSDLIMIGPSPRYIDDDNYRGGFSAGDIEELLVFLADNHLGWSAAMAPAIMGNPERPELAEELTNSFCRTDPDIAKSFARTTFLSDNRNDLTNITTRTLILQCSDDVIAPTNVGEYVHENIAGSQIVYLGATGHCPHLSAPSEVISAIQDFV